ncbi:BON domain-containing protein [Suttonella indologenes]|uniref:Outer membrane lipoprotein n=1 Tax=Suttonella indologenes TaxID=13276 RepID=A0A380N210_9GAMM|nr:BON domain-containing protein [Suttonella indologenes]SUO97951.1 outer membrane lipoprotein [Suttonella indologenes]
MKKIALLTALSAAFLQGCAPLLVGGAATGVMIADDRRTTGTVIDDKTLQLYISNRIASIPRLAENSHVNVNTFNGLVLLTGEAANETIRQDIETVARAMEGTVNVNNHMIIGPMSSLINRSYDAAQTAKVKTVMLDVKVEGFNPNRVKVVTEHGITYLMGIVTQQEANAIANVASRVSGVAQVVTMFEINNQINHLNQPFANEQIPNVRRYDSQNLQNQP